MREKKLFSERLRAAMKVQGLELSGAVLEREFNDHWLGAPVRRQTAWKWLNGETIPTQDKIQALALWLKIEPHELRFGEHVQQQLRASEKLWHEGAGYAERDTFEAFLSLPIGQRKIVREVILAFSKASQQDVQNGKN